MEVGRPTKYKEEYAEQAAKLCALGATDAQMADFFATMPTEDDFYAYALHVIRSDPHGVIARRKEKRKAWRNKTATPAKRVESATRSRVWAALKGMTKGRAFSRLAYSVDELMAHLEERFMPGMSWENYGAWHVDHIRPCSLFNQLDEDEFAQCWSLQNLQPLWAVDNIKKGAQYG